MPDASAATGVRARPRVEDPPRHHHGRGELDGAHPAAHGGVAQGRAGEAAQGRLGEEAGRLGRVGHDAGVGADARMLSNMAAATPEGQDQAATPT